MPANIYKLKDGTIVPGVTTIINQLDKPALIQWAWNLGKEGKDWREERDSAGDIGTLAHALVMSYWTKEDVSLEGYTLEQCDKASHCADKIHLWGDLEDFQPILIEQRLVSEKRKVGGQPDLYGLMKSTGKRRLVDVKTSSGIYETHWVQEGGYDIILVENAYPVDEYQILWLPKHNDFACPIRKNLTKEKKIFKYLLEIYKLRHL